jgi:hypothetical protein
MNTLLAAMAAGVSLSMTAGLVIAMRELEEQERLRRKRKQERAQLSRQRIS